MASSAGVSVEEAKKFINNYYARYPELKAWQDANIEAVTRTRTPTLAHTANGFPRGESVLKSVTGREYRFVEYDAPDWLKERGQSTAFSPTQIKNYPVQGFATGDVVPEVLGRIFRQIYSKPDLIGLLLPINTIHDSIIFDCHPAYVERAVKFIHTIMTMAPEWMYKRFGLTIDMQFPVDIEVGDDWDNLKHA